VPLRAISEALNYDVDWDGATQQITIFNQEAVLSLTIGEKAAIVNGKRQELSLAPQIVQNTTMIPLRFVTESLGQYVLWMYGVGGMMGWGMYIWISPFPLLTDEDTILDENYYAVYPTGDGYPFPSYFLKDDGKTIRGLSLGDSRERVELLYGFPRRVSIDEDGAEVLVYMGKVYPGTEPDSMMVIRVKEGIVESLHI
jgi:hypothetical protein